MVSVGQNPCTYTLYVLQEEEERIAAEMARHAALEQKLKGADYTLDHKGNVILIKPMNPSKMPSNVFGQNAKFKLDPRGEGKGKKGKAVSRSSSAASLASTNEAKKNNNSKNDKKNKTHKSKSKVRELYFFVTSIPAHVLLPLTNGH